MRRLPAGHGYGLMLWASSWDPIPRWARYGSPSCTARHRTAPAHPA
ncbi:hypothetical protein BZL30_2809 [Mycobacterium kansasii]|uniref:Uncharacterized protein n=1 Tax=Mycobacterium kansasii TaxID=1768 RepID=A0A1V3XI93_MYCKA|nr:hypothetical protein BZL30_2809 [Mycobacterium kansasii]